MREASKTRTKLIISLARHFFKNSAAILSYSENAAFLKNYLNFFGNICHGVSFGKHFRNRKEELQMI